MLKFLTIGRMATFIVTFLTTIPLFIRYLKNPPAGKMMFVHVHVWIGLLFFVFAIIGMILQRKMKNKSASR